MVTWNRIMNKCNDAKEWAIFWKARIDLALMYKARGNRTATHKYFSLVKDASEAWEDSNFGKTVV